MESTTIENLEKFSYNAWFPKLTKFCLRSKITVLSDEMLDFILNGDFVIEKEILENLKASFNYDFESVFEEYDYVFIKTNFSSANDSKFMNEELKCLNFEDIVSLMKSSRKIYDDLKYIKELNKDEIKPILVMKKYYDLKPQNEFRVFITNYDYVSITQRLMNVCWDFKDEELERIYNSILSFIKEIKPLIIELDFGDKFYFDCLLLRTNTIKILDISPILDDQSLLIYKEISNLYNLDSYDENKIQMKFINDNRDIYHQENHNNFPLEFIENYTNIEKMIEMMKNNQEL